MDASAKYVGTAVLLAGGVVLGRNAYEDNATGKPAAVQGVGAAAMAVAALVMAMQKTEGGSIAMRTRSRT